MSDSSRHPLSAAALLTGPNPAALAVIELTGALVRDYLAARFLPVAKLATPIHGELRSADGQGIDDPVVVLFSDSHAEISLHGGREIVRRALSELADFGFVGPAALPANATVEERIAAALPLCRTELATRVLLAQRRNQHLLPSSSRALERLLYPPAVAIIGAPNVGKSTLANALASMKVSITADLPGTTRDYVEAEADLGGLIIRLLDTPGQRRTDDPLEAAAIALAQPLIASADLLLIVVDAVRPMTAEEQRLIEMHPRAIVIANRADLGTHVPVGAITTVATTGAGLERVVARIHGYFEITSDLERENLWWPPSRYSW